MAVIARFNCQSGTKVKARVARLFTSVLPRLWLIGRSFELAFLMQSTDPTNTTATFTDTTSSNTFSSRAEYRNFWFAVLLFVSTLILMDTSAHTRASMTDGMTPIGVGHRLMRSNSDLLTDKCRRPTSRRKTMAERRFTALRAKSRPRARHPPQKLPRRSPVQQAHPSSTCCRESFATPCTNTPLSTS
jgi:hypothetical protein